MKPAPHPINEFERLADLISHNILDTDPEVIFDEITQMAAEICETSIALVSIVDENRQWFKSSHGLQAKETPRDISFCGHAILGEELFEVENAKTDDRFFDNPLVVENPNVIFYAGIPLTSSLGHKLGTLCVIDNKPKKLNDLQRKALHSLAQHATVLIRFRKSNLEYQELLEKVNSQAIEMDKYQQQAIKNAKMASLGKMASGIAHEVNNPLAIISMSTGRLKKMIVDQDYTEDDILQSCDRIETTALRIGKIIRGLGAVARISTSDPLLFEFIDDIVNDTLHICHRKFIDSRVTINVAVPKDLKILCRKGEISQVLLNLFSNAFDAIKNDENPWIEVTSRVLNEDIEITITDSGDGIPSEMVQNIMDPFYTTKAAGEGTGLGLSISSSLIEQHGGELVYDSSQNHTTFKIILPNVVSVPLKKSA